MKCCSGYIFNHQSVLSTKYSHPYQEYFDLSQVTNFLHETSRIDKHVIILHPWQPPLFLHTCYILYCLVVHNSASSNMSHLSRMVERSALLLLDGGKYIHTLDVRKHPVPPLLEKSEGDAPCCHFLLLILFKTAFKSPRKTLELLYHVLLLLQTFIYPSDEPHQR